MVIPFLKPPRAVILYLKDPRERFWGLVLSLDATGIVLQGVGVDSFDDWVSRVAGGHDAPQLSTVFFPLGRVEKVLVDASSGSIPALHDHFQQRVGCSLAEYLRIE